MYSGQFDGAAAFAGGGFMPSQTAAAPEASFFSAKNRNVRTLLPLTVKQLSDMSSNDESSATFDGVDVNTVTIVGMVCDMQDKEPQFTFLVDDGTGRIECSRWAHERMEFNEVNQILRGMYVRVYGHLKSLQDKKTLNAYSMRPVIDFNEITSHFIECIYVQMFHTRQQSAITAQPQMTKSTISTPLVDYQAIPSNQYSFDGVKSIDQVVLNFLQRPECLAINNGIHCNDIAKQLNLPMDKLREVLEYLNENSLVYTIDEVHYKSAVNA